MPASDPSPTIQEREIFAVAAALPVTERPAYLDAACGGNLEVRARVEEWLRTHDADSFMEAGAGAPEIEANLARLKPEEVGEWIGPYRLMEQIGQGGFGTVWVANQEKPVRRQVALKIIKLGMDTKEVIARFEQERQALALMDHPHIAKVLDAGATQWGRPFFVMELVRGIKITDYCDQANLPTAERLALFIQVCNAVQHAHQKGIIHRDLKPSNILVTLHDGVPVPKVIDFGVAKATQQQRLTDLTIYTQFQQMIGTPLYMSPEQAEMSGLDIDTRSDIYSLGVLLYELLTGRTPFDPEELMKAGLDEIRRVIREQEPQTPSMFLKTMADETRIAVAQHRQSDPAKLTNLVRGDLDWIVMKSLEKDRTRRYETANAFADDIRRHLTNEPVVARPPGNLYRLRKMVRRNKGAFAAAAGVLATLTAGLATSTYLYLRESEARGRAVAAEQNQVRLREQAESARAAEAAEKQNAHEASLKAESRAKEAELKALEATVVAADSSLRLGDVGSARRRLDTVRPGDRHWEWFWLDGRADSSVVTLATSGDAGLRYDADRQRLIAFGMDTVQEYDPATWKLSGTTTPFRETSTGTVPRGLRDGPSRPEIIGLDTRERRIVFRPWGNLPLALLDREPEPHWVELEVPAEGRVPQSGVAAFNPDGTLLTVAYPAGGDNAGSPAERVAHVWDTATGKIVHSLRSRAGKVMAAVFSPDGNMVATGSVAARASIREPNTDTLCFWDVKSGALLYSCLDEGASAKDLAFSPDGQTIYAGRSFSVAIVDVPGFGAHRGKRAEVPLVGERLECLGLSSKGDVLAIGCVSGHILLLDASSGVQKQILFGYPSGMLKLTFARQDTALAARTRSQIKVWDVASDPRKYVLRGSGAPKFAAWSFDETPVLYAFNPNFNATPGGAVGVPSGWGVAEVWNLASRQVRRLPPAASDMKALAFSAKRNVLAVGRSDGVVELRRAPEGALLTQLKAHDGKISALQFSPDGGALAIGCRDGSASVWDVDGGSIITRMPGDGVEVAHLAFADDGKLLISVTSGYHWEGNTGNQAAVTVSAMRVATWEPLWQWRSERPEGSSIQVVGLVADSRRVILQTSVGELVVLDLGTGAARKVQAAGSRGYSSTNWKQLLALSPDGARLASVDGKTQLVKILRTEDFAEMLTVAPTGDRAGGVSWSPDGTKIAVVGVGETGQDIEILDVLPSQLRAKSAGSAGPR